MTLSIMGLFVTHSITVPIAECHYAKFRVFIVMLSVSMLSVVILNVMLSAVMLSVVLPYAEILKRDYDQVRKEL
jgi:hypothetical protein